MSFSVVTTFNLKGLAEYGQTMIDSFDQHWPRDINLYVYAEACVPKLPSSRTIHMDLLASSPELCRFKQRHRNNPIANGLVMKQTGVPFKDNAFKWDAVRFSHKVFAIFHAIKHVSTDWLIWLDADTKTFAPVTFEFLSNVCNQSALACYLGRREKYHSECGWVGYNRRHPKIGQFMHEWQTLYDSDTIFNLREYHDSFVFDELRKQFTNLYQCYFHNLSPVTSGKGPGHPFIASELGRCIDHMKGAKRKALGHSLPDDYVRNQGLNSDVAYWKKIFTK